MATKTKHGTQKNQSARRSVPLGAVAAVAVVIAVMALLGLNLFQNSQNAPTISGPPPSNGAMAPDFRVTALDGRTFQLSQARGKVVALYFAAAWCPTCVPEAQSWTQLYQQDHARGLEVVMVDVDTSEGVGQWADFRQRTGAGPQVWALDKGLQVASAYGVTSLETSVIIDRQGRIAYRQGQTVPQDLLQQEVGKLL